MNPVTFYSIGSFEQSTDQIIISDPCYEGYDSFLQCLINNVQKGTYNCFVRINKHNGRPARLYATIKKKFKIKDYNWVKFGSICVDSGMAGIYDYNIFKDKDKAEFYRECCELTRFDGQTVQAGTLDLGVVSSSGWGDGVYNVYVNRNDEDEVTAVKVVFMGKKDLAKRGWDE
jgi:hypothetical protein